MGHLEDSKFANKTYFLSRWKGYHTATQINTFIDLLTKHPHFTNGLYLVALPFSKLDELANTSDNERVIFGCTAMQCAIAGSFTESIAGVILKKHQAHFVLIENTLKKQGFNEAIIKALESDITPIFSILESSLHSKNKPFEGALKELICQAIRGLSLKDISRLVFSFEPSWITAEGLPLTLEALKQKYADFRKALHSALGDGPSDQIRVIYALPQDFTLSEEALRALSARGFTSHYPNAILEFLDLHALPALPAFQISEDQTVLISPESTEALQTLERGNLLTMDSREESPEPSIKENPEELLVSSEIPESALAKESRGSESELPPIENEPSPPPCMPALEPEQLSVAAPSEETKQPPAQEISIDFEQTPSRIPTESLFEIDTEDNAISSTSMSPEEKEKILDQSTARVPEPAVSELEALQFKLEQLTTLDRALAECYQLINDKADSLPALKAQFSERLSKMTADLNQLDPALQEQINRGNIGYFQENPDKMAEASTVLQQIQEINQLLQKTASIPRELDRLLSKSRALRKSLEAEWNYFLANRQTIKTDFPELPFPVIPSQLQIPEPKIELTPEDVGPSPLVSKRVAVVKSPPLTK